MLIGTYLSVLMPKQAQTSTVQTCMYMPVHATVSCLSCPYLITDRIFARQVPIYQSTKVLDRRIPRGQGKIPGLARDRDSRDSARDRYGYGYEFRAWPVINRVHDRRLAAMVVIWIHHGLECTGMDWTRASHGSTMT